MPKVSKVKLVLATPVTRPPSNSAVTSHESGFVIPWIVASPTSRNSSWPDSGSGHGRRGASRTTSSASGNLEVSRVLFLT